MREMTMSKIDDYLKKGRTIRRAVNPELRYTEPAEENDAMNVTGYASTFNEPYDIGQYRDCGYDVVIREQVADGAFDEADMTDVCFFYNHHDPVLARHKGKENDTLQLSTDSHGLKIDANLSMSANGKDCYTNIRNGLIDQMSFAFTVAEDKVERTEDRENHIITVLRTITKIGKVYDVSAVDFPANDGTDISARSYSDGVMEQLKAERLERQEREIAKQKLLLRIKLMEA